MTSLSRRRLYGCAGIATLAVACGLWTSIAFAAGDVNRSACSNEGSPGFRVYLSDCRAYELVTPSDKQGALVGPLELPTVAADGASVVGVSTGAFAGLESGELAVGGEAAYRFTRSGSGWLTMPLNPFREERATVGSSDSVWRSAPVGVEVPRITLRESNGVVVDMGPAWPVALGVSPVPGATPFGVVGAASSAADGVLYVIESPRAAWPFDTTVSGNSLYDYVGTSGAAPGLVGVTGGSGSTALISQCGVVLGGPEEEYDAVSASGDKVFFTAEPGGCAGENHNHEAVTGSGPQVSELYVRIAGERTVAISEPTASDCEECETAEGARKPAAFQGASEDGGKAFFTTEQELLPGQKGVNLYEYDFATPEKHKVVLASAGATAPQVQGVARISLDGSHVYFVAKGRLTVEARGGACLEELSPAELVEEETTKEGHCRAKGGADNLYVYERDSRYPSGHVAFVADLCSEPEMSGTIADTQCPSNLSQNFHVNDLVLWGQNEAHDEKRPVQASPDGQFVTFTSYANLTADDSSGARQVFLYDAQTGDLTRISKGQDGFNHDGNNTRAVNEAVDSDASIVSQDYAYGSRGGAIARTMSDSGSYVFFQSAVGLTPQALNLVQVAENAGGSPIYAQNVYEYHDGQVSLVSDGSDTSSAIAALGGGRALIGTSASGEDVFFRTAEPLVPQDTDTQVDFYDARVNGGFPGPEALPTCEGEPCQGTASSSAPAGAPLSAMFAGAGNISPPASRPLVKPKPLSMAQKLAKALRVCAKQSRRRRHACEVTARKRYHRGSRAKASGGRSK